MRLLILTQKVDINDDILGFFHGWIAEFAKNCESVLVVCLYEGQHNLPGNVRVLSLGKEKFIRSNSYHSNIIRRLVSIYRFYSYIWQERQNYDSVFVHMNHEYVLLGGWLWRLLGKKIGLWYTHKSVNFKLRIAEKMVDVIFTASKESFRLPSKKLKVLGHGIDIKKFTLLNNFSIRKISANAEFNRVNIITIGRISPIKDYETLIAAAEILQKENFKFNLQIIGGPATENDKEYLIKLKKSVQEKGLGEEIKFIGSIPNKNIANYYQSADLFVNLSHTGSLDKVVLEAMASSLPVLTCNEALIPIISEYKGLLFFKKKDSVELAEKIKSLYLLESGIKDKMINFFQEMVARDHNLETLAVKILECYQKI